MKRTVKPHIRTVTSLEELTRILNTNPRVYKSPNEFELIKINGSFHLLTRKESGVIAIYSGMLSIYRDEGNVYYELHGFPPSNIFNAHFYKCCEWKYVPNRPHLSVSSEEHLKVIVKPGTEKMPPVEARLYLKR